MLRMGRAMDDHRRSFMEGLQPWIMSAILDRHVQGQSEIGDLYLCLKANPFGRELQYKFIESP